MPLLAFTEHRFKTNRPSLMSKIRFIEVFGPVYEHSPWIAEQTYDNGLTPHHDNVTLLWERMRATVLAAPREKKLHLIRQHPDLADRIATQKGALTVYSHGEQAAARLDACTEAEFKLFESYNKRYRKAFEMPFIVAVKGLTRPEILKFFKERLKNHPETEFEENLEQIHRIARFRLQDIA